MAGDYTPDTVECFVEVIARDAALPARGRATFALDDPAQPGVTVVAVEDVGDSNRIRGYQVVGSFRFLLHRLPPGMLAPGETRTVEVGMCLDGDGRFTVSVYDANDPEHVEKRKRALETKGEDANGFGDVDAAMPATTAQGEQVFLAVLCAVVVVVLYMGVRVVFSQMEADAVADAEL